MLIRNMVDHTPTPTPERTRQYSTPWSQRPSDPPTPIARTPTLNNTSIIPLIKAPPIPPPTPPLPAPTPIPANIIPAKRKQPLVKKKYSPKITQESDKTTVLRLCKKREGEYGRIPNVRFWKKIAIDYCNLKGGDPHSSLSRVVTGWVKTRRAEKEEETGEQDPPSSYIQAIDEWIEVLDTRKATEERQREYQGHLDQETETSLRWRENQFNSFKEKEALDLEEGEEEEGNNSKEEEEEDLE